MRTMKTLALATALGLTLTGAALAESRNFDVKDFDRIDISTGIDAVVTIGDRFAVSADSASADALQNLRVDVSGGVLKASFDQSFLDFIISGGLVGMLLSNGNAITVDITMPAVAGISTSSGADVRASGLKSNKLDLDASSGSDITLSQAALGAVRASASSGANMELSGTCETIDAEASSGSGISAGDLVCENATVEVSSGADIEVHATGTLKAEASSGGDVDVAGRPTRTDFESSSGGDVSFEEE
ncbi:head GIN domain-containing protein [Devosia lacusdianchii]|uniref:head GIN domain-containing protein n=1 Tax=Devosia lacusdianchii TaxID=2917991 RepID=UPI001F055840|nr:head GIN domain-containing protein [Devosia sp. JXJ CY 41]